MGLIKVNAVKRWVSAAVLVSYHSNKHTKRNNMKKTILIAFAAMLTIATYAQQPGKPMNGRCGQCGMQQGRQGKDKIKQELNLTEAQQKQMKTIQEDFRTKMKGLRENESITVKEQRDRIYKLGQEHRATMQKVLTPEQKQKMVAMREDQAKKMQEKQGQHFEKVSADLNLNDAQKTQMKQLHEKQMAAVKTVRDNEGLDRTARQTTMKNLMEQHKRDMQKVLSKEQFEQWEKMRQDQFAKGGQGKGGQGKCGP
jgi:Spy/CpxP family protein refolding chaperone